MSSEQDQDRSEKATPFKLEEARKRGQVAKSQDVLSLAALLVLAASFFALVPKAIQDVGALMSRSLNSQPEAFADVRHAHALMMQAVIEALQALSPLLFILVIVAIAVQVLQTGVVLSTTPLKPDWQRLNPAKGFKRLVSVRLLYEAVKSTLKLLAMAVATVLVLQSLLPGTSQLHAVSTKTFLSTLAEASGSLAVRVSIVLALFAMLDLLYVRWDYLRTLRMSRREILDEFKHRDGDPRIKARLRELRQEYLRRAQAVSRVSEAEVLVTNPTHIAVALRYRHGESPAPQLLAKGAGSLAARMREVAYRSGVPIVHSPALARALFKEVKQDAYLPERWYGQVARILVWVHAARQARAGGLAAREQAA